MQVDKVVTADISIRIRLCISVNCTVQKRKMSELVVKNIVFVGDGSVGKTSLLYAYSNQGGFRVSYVPTMWVDSNNCFSNFIEIF